MFKTQFAREMAFVLLVKVTLLFGLWYCFFKHNDAHDVSLAKQLLRDEA